MRRFFGRSPLKTFLWILRFQLSLTPFCLPLIAISQDGDFSESWRLVRFSHLNGLPADQVSAVAEGRGGTIWAAGPKGVSWYDGFRWTAVPESLGLPQSPATGLVALQDGDVLVTTGGTLYSGNNHRFRMIAGPTHVTTVLQIDERSLLIQELSSLFILRDGVLQEFPHQELTRGKTVNIFRTLHGTIWVNLVSGLYRWESNNLRVAIPARTGRFWVSGIDEDSGGSGMASIDYSDRFGELWTWSGKSTPQPGSTSNEHVFRQFVFGSDGERYGLTISGEIFLRREGEWSPLKYLSFQVRNVLSLQPSGNGDLWICSTEGLYLFKKSSTRWRSWKDSSRAASNVICEILNAKNGDLWLGTSDGVKVYKAGGGEKFYDRIGSTRLHAITGLAQDRDGNIWISSGSALGGAFRWDGNKWDHANITPDSSGIRIHRISKDREGNLWFLGLTRGAPGVDPTPPGAYVLKDGRFEPWGVREGLLNGRVYSFAEGSDGSLWFGTGGGLSRWHHGAWKHWTREDELKFPEVFTLAIDSANTVWFGDRHNGLCRVDSTLRLRYFTVESGLVSNVIWDLAVGPDGTLWIATGEGLGSYREGTFLSFDDRSGLAQIQLWPVTIMNNLVYVGTQGSGVDALDISDRASHKVRIYPYPPIVDGRSALLRWNAFAFWEEQRTQDIKTSYRLDDQPWTDWALRDNMTLDSLSPGTHLVHIRGLDFFGGISEGEQSLSFVIEPPFYERAAFLLPAGAGFLVIVVLALNQYVNKRKYTQSLRALTASLSTTEERERQQLAIYLHETIGQSLAFCKNKLGALRETFDPKAVDELNEHLSSAIRDTQSITRQLSPPMLADMRLEDAISWLGDEMQRKHDLLIYVENDGQQKPLPNELRLFLFHAVRELVTNIVKHSSAKSVEISLRRIQDSIQIEVSDDGIGFDPGAVGRIHDGGGFGLLNIRERIRFYGGKIQISSKPKSGTRISISVPITLPAGLPHAK